MPMSTLSAPPAEAEDPLLLPQAVASSVVASRPAPRTASFERFMQFPFNTAARACAAGPSGRVPPGYRDRGIVACGLRGSLSGGTFPPIVPVKQVTMSNRWLIVRTSMNEDPAPTGQNGEI